MPRLADLPIRRVRPLEPREHTEFRVAQLPPSWKEDTRPAHPETGVFTIEDTMLWINEDMSLVPRIHDVSTCRCSRCNDVADWLGF